MSAVSKIHASGIHLSFTDGSVRYTTVSAVAGHRIAQYLQPDIDHPHEADVVALFADDIEIFGAMLEMLGARMCTPTEAAAVVHQWPTAAQILAADAAGLPWLALALDGDSPALGVAILGPAIDPPIVAKRPPRFTQKRVALSPD